MTTAPNEVPGGSIDNEALQAKLKVIALNPVMGGLVVDTQVSLGVGGQVAEGAVGGAELPAFSCTTNDEVYFSVALAELWDCDFRRDMQVAVVYNTVESIAENDIGFSVDIKGVASGVAPSDAQTAPDGSAAWTDLISAEAGFIYQTSWRPLNCQGAFVTFADEVVGRLGSALDVLLMLALVCTNKGSNASADDLRIHKLLLRFTLEMCHFSGARQLT